MLSVCEIFTSIQGESSLAGYPCTFVRLAGCNLRCVWCDTTYSYSNDDDDRDNIRGNNYTTMTVDEVIAKITGGGIKLVEITGGEPLLQPAAVIQLCEKLLTLDCKVMIETNGSQDISTIPQSVKRIIDIKCPGSGNSSDSFLLDNLNHINSNDEIKFVVASIDDCEWARDFCHAHNLYDICPITFSPVSSSLSHKKLSDWMLDNKIHGIRLGVQLHKIIGVA